MVLCDVALPGRAYRRLAAAAGGPRAWLRRSPLGIVLWLRLQVRRHRCPEAIHNCHPKRQLGSLYNECLIQVGLEAQHIKIPNACIVIFPERKPYLEVSSAPSVGMEKRMKREVKLIT